MLIVKIFTYGLKYTAQISMTLALLFNCIPKSDMLENNIVKPKVVFRKVKICFSGGIFQIFSFSLYVKSMKTSYF